MKLSVGKKLGLGFGALVALMLLNAAIAYLKAADIRKSQDTTIEMRFPAIEAARELQRDLNYTQVKGRQAILAGTDPARWQDAKKGFEGAWTSIGKDVALLDQLAPTWPRENRDQLEAIKQKLPELRETEE
ncbi:MAG TPA: MCP four helix bundle domain-containing protein, partial [Candidatus Angelobacter sp.]